MNHLLVRPGLIPPRRYSTGKGGAERERTHKIIGSGTARLADVGDEVNIVGDEVNIAWKGELVPDEVVDHTFLTGKTGEHFELTLLDGTGTPRIPATVRHIEGLRVQLVGSDPLATS